MIRSQSDQREFILKENTWAFKRRYGLKFISVVFVCALYFLSLEKKVLAPLTSLLLGSPPPTHTHQRSSCHTDALISAFVYNVCETHTAIRAVKSRVPIL